MSERLLDCFDYYLPERRIINGVVLEMRDEVVWTLVPRDPKAWMPVVPRWCAKALWDASERCVKEEVDVATEMGAARQTVLSGPDNLGGVCPGCWRAMRLWLLKSVFPMESGKKKSDG